MNELEAYLLYKELLTSEIERSPTCPYFQLCQVGGTKSCKSIGVDWKKCSEISAHVTMWRRLLLFQRLK